MRLAWSSLALLVALSACKKHEPPKPREVLAQAKPARKPPPPPDAPALYTKYCALCHGPARQGYAADNAPSLASTTFLATVSEDFLRLAIERGRPGTAMAAYAQKLEGPLRPEEVTAIVKWLLGALPAEERIALPTTPITGDAAAGKNLYLQHCDKCHGNAAERRTALQLVNPTLLVSASDAFLEHAIVHGRPGTPMKPLPEGLRPADVAPVVAYLRSLAPANPDLVVAAAPVGRERALPHKGPIVINPEGRQADFRLKDDRLVSLEGLKQALDEKRRLVIVDARPPSEWNSLHITGSISLPYYDLGLIDELPRDGTWIIAYCACPHHASGVVVDELRRRKFPHTAVLDEGIFAWQRAGYPVVAAPGTLPVPAPPAAVLDTVKLMQAADAHGTLRAGGKLGAPVVTGRSPSVRVP